MLRVEAEPGADAVYIQLLDEPVGFTKEMDENRIIDYTLNPGTPVGVDLLMVSKGVKVTGLPEEASIRKILEGLGVTIID